MLGKAFARGLRGRWLVVVVWICCFECRGHCEGKDREGEGRGGRKGKGRRGEAMRGKGRGGKGRRFNT